MLILLLSAGIVWKWVVSDVSEASMIRAPHFSPDDRGSISN
jgi:hypothetical protein